ncbi:MAG: endonuclease III, partial [bacterium]|nr:endonuclease III [bacterium]
MNRADRPTSPILRQGYEGHVKLRRARAKKIAAYLKKKYTEPKSELVHTTQFQFVVAVILSAQCTDKAVNKLTTSLFRNYKSVKDFANANPDEFVKE